MWKDFFYYSKSERRAILLLLAVAVVLLGIWMAVPRQKDGKVLEDSPQIAAVDSFRSEIKERRKSRYVPRKTEERERKPKEMEAVLFPFDPNVADSAALRRLGLSAFATRNVLKYRDKGGRFRTPESFSRIYGLSKEQYEQLVPYIRIAGREERHDSAEVSAVDKPAIFKKDSSFVSSKYPEGTVIDLNKADTTELKRIPGIGRGLARMIVAYRNRLGGFYEVSQLQEIPYIAPETNRWFKVDGQVLRKLKVNRSGLDRLRNHPYMNFYKAKAILEYRRRRGDIKNISRLASFEEFSEEDISRLAPYLSFE